jgi:hypothetical protein
MIDRCLYCHTPLESDECSLCSILHQIGLCVQYEKDFLEYSVWPELQRSFHQEFPPEVVVELQDNEDEDIPLDRVIRAASTLDARVSLMARMWHDYPSVVRQQRQFIARHQPVAVFWAWMPLVAAQRARLEHDECLQMVYNWMFFSGLRALVDSVRQGKRDDDIFRAAVTAMQNAFEGLPLVHGAWMAMTNDPVEREIRLTSLSGLIATGISLKQKTNPRLYNTLLNDVAADPEAPTLSTALYRKLPGSILLAWLGTPLTTQEFIHRIHRSLVSDGPAEASKNVRHVVPPEQPLSVEELWIQAEAHSAMALDNPRMRARFTPRQLELCDVISDLLRQDEVITNAKIAARMDGIAENTVKAMTFQMRKRLHT